MSQSTSRQRWAALQITLALAYVLVGCAAGVGAKPDLKVVAAGSSVPQLQHIKSIRSIPYGSGDAIKRVLAGQDEQELSRPTAIGVRGQFVYIADGDLAIVFKYDLLSGRMTTVPGVGDMLVGDAADIFVAVDSSIYVADPLGKRVLHFSSSGDFLGKYEDATNLSRPVSVLVDASGNVLVGDEVYSLIVAFNPAGEAIYGMGGRGEGPGRFRFITDIAAVADGFVVGDRVELPVQILDKKGKYISHFGERVVEFPTALVVDESGRIYVFDKADSRIKIFKDGQLTGILGRNGYGDGEFRFVSDMKYADGKLYVADTLNARIQIFSVTP